MRHQDFADAEASGEGRERGMQQVDVMAAMLLVMGGLNWGLVRIFGADAVGSFFESRTGVSRSIYSMVRAGALYQALQWQALQGRLAYAEAGRRP
jgi:uncharacterized membrane protein YuzA (DUF378 family)